MSYDLMELMALQTKLSDQLAKLREAAEEREAERIAKKTGISYLNAVTAPVKIEALKLVPEARARRAELATFELKKPAVAVALNNPDNPEAKKIIKEFETRGLQPRLFVVSRRGIEHFWSFYRFATDDKAPITSRVNIEKERVVRLAAELTKIESVKAAIGQFDFEKQSVTDFLEIVLSGAMANRASDVHFEPEEKGVRLRYRVDGALHDVIVALRRDVYPAVVSRIKLLSNLKINIQDRPQDGRFTIGLPTKEVEMRVAIAPAEFGETIVMRILDPDAINLSLKDLGLRKDDLEIIQVELNRPNGMILNTGPTGSGKTTTLYAFLRTKYDPELKIITVEDPIEYHLPGIEQTQVDEEAGYTFANGLRSIMRQDPDVILIGEVRDKDTAEIAVQAALTGHLVFSTVHANSAAGAVPRLLDLGVRPTSLGPAMNLVIGQRLVRRLCQFCKQPKKLSPELKAGIEKFLEGLPVRVDRNDYKEITIFEPKGCDKCGSFGGYRGRVAIYELLLNDPEFEKIKEDSKHNALASEKDLEELILKQAGESEIASYASNRGMVTMQQDGVLKVINGITTFEEIEETTGRIGWLHLPSKILRSKT